MHLHFVAIAIVIAVAVAVTVAVTVAVAIATAQETYVWGGLWLVVFRRLVHAEHIARQQVCKNTSCVILIVIFILRPYLHC